MRTRACGGRAVPEYRVRMTRRRTRWNAGSVQRVPLGRRLLLYPPSVLLDGVNHVAVLTRDTERLSRFYTQIFDAPPARAIEQQPGFKLSLIDIGAGRELNVFEIDGNAEVDRQTPMFGRGRLDHVGLQ